MSLPKHSQCYYAGKTVINYLLVCNNVLLWNQFICFACALFLWSLIYLQKIVYFSDADLFTGVEIFKRHFSMFYLSHGPSSLTSLMFN